MVGGFALALPALAVLYALNNRGASGKKLNLFKIFLALTVGIGLAYTFLANWLNTVLGWLADWIGRIPLDNMAAVAAAVPAVVTLVALTIAAIDLLVDRKADRPAQLSLAATPMLVLTVAGGLIGQYGGSTVEAAREPLSQLVQTMVGG